MYALWIYDLSPTVFSWYPLLKSLEHIVARPEWPDILLPARSILAWRNMFGKYLGHVPKQPMNI